MSISQLIWSFNFLPRRHPSLFFLKVNLSLSVLSAWQYKKCCFQNSCKKVNKKSNLKFFRRKFFILFLYGLLFLSNLMIVSVEMQLKIAFLFYFSLFYKIILVFFLLSVCSLASNAYFFKVKCTTIHLQ